MKRFSFPLEKVLEVREIKRLLAEEKLGLALREKSRAEASLYSALKVRAKAMDDWRRALTGRLDPVLVRDIFRYGEVVEEEVRQRREQLKQRDLEVQVARKEVLERTQEEKALRRYRQKKLSEYRAWYWWEQGKILDEIGTDRFTRRERRW
ncbi:MAG TPA: hypothetical protein GXX30_11085 [Firmicutes bacterium]|nr:hypothetical protein [Candidatus Fermentithermobacillaceae bacterium]